MKPVSQITTRNRFKNVVKEFAKYDFVLIKNSYKYIVLPDNKVINQDLEFDTLRECLLWLRSVKRFKQFR